MPWIDFAWEINQDLNDDQIAEPRLFKSHARLSAVQEGCKASFENYCVASPHRSTHTLTPPPFRPTPNSIIPTPHIETSFNLPSCIPPAR